MTTLALSVAYLGRPIEVQVDSTQLVYDGERFVPASRAVRVVLTVSTSTSSVPVGSIPNQIVCGVLGVATLAGTPPTIVQTPAIVSGVPCSLLGTQVQGVSIVVSP